jgi:hypothetical protein
MALLWNQFGKDLGGTSTTTTSTTDTPQPSLGDQVRAEYISQITTAIGRPPTEAEIALYVTPRLPDAIKDVQGGGETLAGRVSRGLQTSIDALRTGATEASQTDFNQRLLDMFQAGETRSSEQFDLFKQGQEEIKNLQPFLFESMGLTPEYDENGVLTGLAPMAEEALMAKMTPLERDQYQVAKETSARQLKALRGEVDLDPMLEKELTDQETMLRESLSRRLGPNWEDSTAGIQSMSKFREMSSRVRESSRLEILGQGQGLLSSALSNIAGMTAGKTGTAATIPTLPFQPTLAEGLSRSVAAPFAGVQSSPAVFSGFQSVLQPGQFRANLSNQFAMQQMASDTGSPWPALLATVVGQGAGAYLAGR